MWFLDLDILSKFWVAGFSSGVNFYAVKEISEQVNINDVRTARVADTGGNSVPRLASPANSPRPELVNLWKSQKESANALSLWYTALK